MSEATRLESLVRQSGRERFDAREVVEGCVKGYASIYPNRKFSVSAPGAPVMLRGAPDLYAQMLDKLAANAADFASGEEPIRVRLDAQGSLTVSNSGPLLPEDMAGRLFQSMVSGRSGSGGEPHLGLGLYIVRLIAEFHGGRARAANREDASGVLLKVDCPVA
jgi:signal transduction histidine kinase